MDEFSAEFEPGNGEQSSSITVEDLGTTAVYGAETGSADWYQQELDAIGVDTGD